MKKQEYSTSDEQIIQMLTPKVEVTPSADLRERILNAAQAAGQQTSAPKSDTQDLALATGWELSARSQLLLQ